jgi:hypothetical protein
MFKQHTSHSHNIKWRIQVVLLETHTLRVSFICCSSAGCNGGRAKERKGIICSFLGGSIRRRTVGFFLTTHQMFVLVFTQPAKKKRATAAPTGRRQ